MLDKVCDAELIILLRKSKTRRMVLGYLAGIYPKKSYAAEIARKTDLRPTDVCGALNGVPNRFKKENSLVELGLVEKHEEKDGCLYSTTKEGREILHSLGI